MLNAFALAPLPFYTLYDFKKFIQKLEITTLAPESSQNPFAYKNTIDSKAALEYELIFDLLSIPQKEYDTTLKLHEKLNKLQKTQYTSHIFFAGLIGDYEYFKTIHDQTSPLDQRNAIAAAIYGGNQECINLSLQSLEQGDAPSSQEIDNLFHDAIITSNYTLLMHLSHKDMQATTIQTAEPMQLIFCYNYFSHFLKKHHHTSLLHKHFFYAQQRHAYHVLASLFAHLKKTPLLT